MGLTLWAEIHIVEHYSAILDTQRCHKDKYATMAFWKKEKKKMDCICTFTVLSFVYRVSCMT